MGRNYMNSLVFGIDEVQLCSSLHNVGISACVFRVSKHAVMFVSPMFEELDDEAISLACVTLSRICNGTVITTINHDDSMLSIEVCRTGKIVASYHSPNSACVGQTSTDDFSNQAKSLVEISPLAQVDPRELIQSLKVQMEAPHGSNEYNIFELDRHRGMFRALGLPTVALCASFAPLAEVWRENASVGHRTCVLQLFDVADRIIC